MESRLNIKDYLERIESDFFEPINSHKIIQQGWTNLIIEINEQWIFRFVRDKNNHQIAVEQGFLPRFAEVSPINVPQIIMSDKPNGMASLRDYIAYPKILGERFSPEKFLLFSNFQKTEIIKLLRKFLTCLHNFQFDHPYLSDAPYGGGDFWNDLWFLVKDDLGDQTKNKAEKLFQL